MQTFLHYRWRVPSTLHRLHPRRIIPLLLLALCVTGAKAQTNVKFNGDIRYSKWVIDSRMNDFYANTTPCGFAVYDQSGKQTSARVDGKTELDYVVGLVAKSIIEASQYYSQYTWAQSFAKPWFLSIQNYGDYFYNRFRSTSGSLDDLNAVKLFIPLRALTETKGKYPDETTHANATTALNTALSGLGTHNKDYSIKTGTLAETAGKTVLGGWWHKQDYKDQMWLDGSYMGPALFAELVNYSGSTTNIDATNDWALIVKQFTILRDMCWNETAKLPYHAFAADGGTNSTSHSDTWEGLSSIPTYCFHSASYWGRAVGWYFLALVDVLEQMDNAKLTSTEGYTTLLRYLTETAEGIKARQDQTTGGWYQILDKDNKYSASSYDNGQQHTTTYNYIESSATALFTAAYLKAIRKGYLDDVATYKTVAVNGYKCLVNNFFSVDENGKVNIFGSCRSAGLGGSGNDYKAGAKKYRDGSNAYYLLGSDVARVDKSENETEGKVLGAFIMAATEYEIANQKDIRFSYDLAPTYTLAQGKSIKAEALGSGTITYQWYKTTDGTTGTAVSGATSETFSPKESGSYYCEAKSGSTTIKTSPTVVTVSGTSNVTLPSTNPVVWTFTNSTLKSGTLGTEKNVVEFTSTDASSTVMTYVSGSDDAIVPSEKTINDVSYTSFLKENGKGYVNGRRCMEFKAPSSKGTVTIVYASPAAKMTIVDGGNNNAQLAELNATENTAVTSGELTTTVGNKIIIYCPANKSYIYSVIWTPINETYTVSLNATGVTGYPQTKTYSGEALDLPTPEKTGYTFYGWYTAEKGGNEVDNPYTPTDNITLYAQWTPISDLFTLTGVTSTNVSVNSHTTVTVSSDYATITGGSAELHNGHPTNEQTLILSSQINLNGSGSSYLKITLDKPLQVGDKIIIKPATSSFKLSATVSNSGIDPFTGSYVIKEGDAVVGKDVIFLYRGANSNSVIEDINISRSYPESDSRATFTYNGAEIAFSEKIAGDKSAYTTTLEIGASKKGEFITITPTKQKEATITTQEGTDVSEGITITVPSTIGSTTTSKYTVTSKDKTSTTTYEINVTLVKENVVLEYAQREETSSGVININKAWTWDTTENPTNSGYTQPTLKVYLAKADGTKSETEVTKYVTGIKYMSDVKDVATVDENTGTITINENANGGAKIYAILEKNEYYNDAQTSFNIIVKQGFSYSVATDTEIENGPDLNKSVYIMNGDTKLVKMTFGGWKWDTSKDENNKLISTYEVNSSTRTDGWNKPATSDETEIASIDGYKTYISGYSDAVDESKKKSDVAIYGSTRYGWFKPAKTRDDGYLETYPYTLPVRGAYMTFEPTQNGTLTVYILQNGAWNTFDKDTERDGVLYKNGDIIPGEFRPHSFYICNQRGLNADQFSPKSFKYTTKQKVQGDYYCNLTEHLDDPNNIATWDEFSKNMSADERSAVETNWKNGINYGQSIVQLDNGSFLAIQKGIVKYTFFVTANETYYMFSNFSKLGFCGANFVPSKTVIPTDDAAHKITLSDEIAYKKPEKVNEDENNYHWDFGKGITGYVKDFTIPLFKSITLNRTFTKNRWTTLTLPFNLTQTEVEQIFGKGTQILVFEDAITNGTKLHIKFFYHEIQNILPGYPYLIKPTLVDDKGADMTTKETATDQAPTYTITDGVLKSFTVYDKAINPNIELHKIVSGNKLYVAQGTPDYCKDNTVMFDGKDYKYSTEYHTGDLFISDYDGKLYESEGDSYGKGYRSFIDYTGTSSASKSLTVSFSGVEDSDDNGGTTEIKVAELDNGIRQALGFVGVYNLNGQKVAGTTHNLPAGIYIVNGRKLVVK